MKKVRVKSGEYSLLKEFNRSLKDFRNTMQIQELVPLVEKIDKSNSQEEKIEYINTLLHELYTIRKAAEQQVRMSKYALIFSSNNMNIIAKLNYDKIFKTNNNKVYAILNFERELYLMLRELNNACKQENVVENDR